MALNHTLGIDVKGLPIQRSVGIRPSFIGNNRLMFITHRTARYTEAEEVRMVVEGGCSWVQLRMKDGLEKATVQACVDICTSAKTHNVDLCIDDNLETALECGATACHLGKKDNINTHFLSSPCLSINHLRQTGLNLKFSPCLSFAS